MPTYQYRCTQCGSELEAVQKFTDPSLTTCPECQGALRKVFSAVGVVFKGSGFYATDSRSSKSATTAGSPSNGASKSDAAKADAPKGDSAPAKKESSPAASSPAAAGV